MPFDLFLLSCAFEVEIQTVKNLLPMTGKVIDEFPEIAFFGDFLFNGCIKIEIS